MPQQRTLGQWFRNLLLVDLLIGLATSGKHLFWKKFTVQYPEQRIEPAERFRGMFKYLPQVCNGCTGCARACPIDIIYVDWHWDKTPEGKKKKVIDRYDIDLKRCMFCGLCEEACPLTPVPIRLTTKSYEGAVYERDMELYFDMKKLHEYTGLPDPEIEDKPKPAPEPKPAPPAEAGERAEAEKPAESGEAPPVSDDGKKEE